MEIIVLPICGEEKSHLANMAMAIRVLRDISTSEESTFGVKRLLAIIWISAQACPLDARLRMTGSFFVLLSKKGRLSWMRTSQ
jgi:hypothetical protein